MTKRFTGPLAEALEIVPEFARFAPDYYPFGPNPNLDLVVRRVGPASPAPVPVALVSKTYRIIQHREVLQAACDFLGQIPDVTVTDVTLHATENWERILFEVMVGGAQALNPDGHAVGLRLVCRNSVDGSCAVRSHLGWFRFVCSNGLIVGVTLGKTRLAHKPGAAVRSLFDPLEESFALVNGERKTLAKWTAARVAPSELRAWVNGPVAEQWNSLAAARVWHITRTGRDARFVPPFRKAVPSEKKVELLHAVPGAPSRSATVYDVAQALSYVASHRRDVEEAEAFQREIGPLLGRLSLDR
jgi:hypothetical protein